MSTDITLQSMQSEIGDSILEAPIVAQIPHTGEWRQAPGEGQAEHGESVFDDSKDYFEEALYAQEHNVAVLGDEGLQRKLEQEQGGERPRSERPEIAEWAKTGGNQAQQSQTQEQVQEQQIADPTPQQVAQIIQELDTKIEERGLSDTADTSKFGNGLAAAFGADVQRDGWNVGLLNSTVARIALSTGPALVAAEGDLDRLPPLSAPIVRQISRDTAMSFGINPQINPVHDEQLLANVMYRGMANLLNTIAQSGGESDPGKLNDGQMAVWFCEGLVKGLFGVEVPVTRATACQIVNCLTNRIMEMDTKVRGWQERMADQSRQGQGSRSNTGRGRGQRIPSELREGIRGRKVQSFSSNQDIFSGQVMADLAMRRL
jgi:hypothetical protein